MSRTTRVTRPVNRLRMDSGYDDSARGSTTRFSSLLSKASQRCAIDHLPTRHVGGRCNPTTLGPAADGVVAHPEQLGGFLDPKRWHPADSSRIIGVSIEFQVHLLCYQLETEADARDHVRRMITDSGLRRSAASRRRTLDTTGQMRHQMGTHPRTSFTPTAVLSCGPEITDTEEVTGSNLVLATSITPAAGR